MASIEAWFRKNFTASLEAHFVSLGIQDEQFTSRQVFDTIDRLRPAFIAVGVYIWNEKLTQEVLQYVRHHHPEATVILGGPQITHGNQHLSEDYCGAHFFIRGAGEEPFTELMNCLVSGSIPSLQLLDKYGIFAPSLAEGQPFPRPYYCPIENLESPYLNGTLLLESGARFARWETLRGCPYACAFCQFREIGSGVQKFGLEKLKSEIHFFAGKKVQEIAVLDPIFNLNHSHYLPLLEEISKSGLSAHLALQCRMELLLQSHGEKFLQWCRKHQNVTLEFGLQTFVEAESTAVNRNNDFDKISQAIDKLNHYGINFDLHLIYGLPFQTLDSLRISIAKAVEARPNRLYLFPLNLLKGTPIWEKRDEFAYVFDPEKNNQFTASKWMNAKEVQYLTSKSDEINQQAKNIKWGERQALFAEMI